MRIKSGVRLSGLKPETLAGMMIVDSVYSEFGKELVITSVTDGKHSERSHHYAGEAFDCRTRYFSDDAQKTLQKSLQNALGQDFIVILESTHIHIQFTPKRLK